MRLDQEELFDDCAPDEVEEEQIEEDGDPQGPPSAKRRVSSCALAELLGNTFGDARQAPAPPEKSAFERAEKEVQKYNTAAPLPLSESPLDWWKEHHHEYPLLAKLAKRYLCVPGTSFSVCSLQLGTL